MFNALSHLANIGHFRDDIFTGPMTQPAAPKLWKRMIGHLKQASV